MIAALARESTAIQWRMNILPRFARGSGLVGVLVCMACGDSSTGDAANGGNGGAGQGGDVGGGAPPQPPADDLYGPSIDEVVLEIDYLPGAEPYTEQIGTFGDPFDLFRANAQALFDAAGGKTITVPSDLSDMEELEGETSQPSYTGQDILALADRHRDQSNGDGVAAFYVIWLDGLYDDGDAVRDNVLGVSIGDSGVIAMFKPVIDGGAPLLGVDRYVEQATLIHEFGHAAGLVDNGVEMATPHKDAEHGAHCSNTDCIMYWTVEGRAAALELAREITSSDTILWGSECLADAAKAAGQ